MPRPPKDKDKVKSKNVKVSEECHKLIGKIGRVFRRFWRRGFKGYEAYANCPHVRRGRRTGAGLRE